MTTRRQVTRLFRTLMERNPDLEQTGNWLLVKPVRHLIRGIVVDRTGEARRFRVWWAVFQLCDPRDSIPMSWGEQIFGAPDQWVWSNPNLEAEFISAVEEHALPRIRSIESLEAFLDYTNGPSRWSYNPFDDFLLLSTNIDIALGKLDAAREKCRQLASGKTMWSSSSFTEEFERVSGSLCKLLAEGDREGMAKLLHEWEAQTVAALGIEHIWEKTPFPLELE